MTKTRWSQCWQWLAVVALAVIAASSSTGQEAGTTAQDASAAEPAAAAEARESAVWGKAPVLPWDEAAVKEDAWSRVLDLPLDLTRKGKPDERRCYEIRRVNLTLDRHGRIASRIVAEGRLTRTLVEELEPGLWRERFDWQRFAVGQSMGPDAHPALREFPGARGLAYDFSPRTFDYVNIPADFSRLGDEMAGSLMKVVGMDLTGFDALLLGMRDDIGSQVRIGQSFHDEAWTEPTEIGAVTSPDTTGRYTLGALRSSLAGITRWRGEPCALIWFSAEGNHVVQEFGNEQFALRMDGMEYFRGQFSVSLVDGRVVAGELWGPLALTMALGVGGQEPQEQPVSAILQQVSLWEVPAE